MDFKNENFYYAVLIIGTLVIASILVLILRKSLNLLILRNSKSLKVDPTNYAFLKNSAGFIVYTIAIIFIFMKIPFLRSLGTALFAGAGIFAAIIGFASQKAFANIISGIFILIFKPFKMNDVVEFTSGSRGIVEEITLRHTIIRNFENRRMVIPNGIISEDTLINSNIRDAKIRLNLEFGISYDSNVDHAINIIQDEALKHPNCIDNRTAIEKADDVPVVIVRLIELSDFSVNLRAYIWATNNADAFVMKCDLLKSVFDRFNREGIEVPFPYRTIVYKKDLEAQISEES